MDNLSQEQMKKRERTLLFAILLSMWAPLTTGLAVWMSQSTTQLADFIRRTVELLALIISYLVFRYLVKNAEMTQREKLRLERIAGFSVAGAMLCSGLIMLILSISRIDSFTPGGNVYPGLAIAFLGLIVNSWFWRRYARFHREEPQTVMGAQQSLYRAKALMDLCVLLALLWVALAPYHPITRFMDIMGSLLVALYLMASSIKTAKRLPENKEIVY